MNLKLSELINLYFELNGLTKQNSESEEIILLGILKQKLSLKTKVYMTRLNKIATDEYKIFEELKKEIIKEYVVEENNQMMIPKEKIDAFNSSIAELLNTDKHIDTSAIFGEDFSIDNFNDLVTDEYYPTLIKLIDTN